MVQRCDDAAAGAIDLVVYPGVGVEAIVRRVVWDALRHRSPVVRKRRVLKAEPVGCEVLTDPDRSAIVRRFVAVEEYVGKRDRRTGLIWVDVGSATESVDGPV